MVVTTPRRGAGEVRAPVRRAPQVQLGLQVLREQRQGVLRERVMPRNV
jgi:hypothetical protein